MYSRYEAMLNCDIAREYIYIERVLRNSERKKSGFSNAMQFFKKYYSVQQYKVFEKPKASKLSVFENRKSRCVGKSQPVCLNLSPLSQSCSHMAKNFAKDFD